MQIEELLPHIRNGSHEIFYKVLGEGDCIVMLHGIFTDHRDWIRNGYTELLHDKKIVLIDLRGHGKSGKYFEPESYNVMVQADDIYTVLSHLQVEKATIWGYSFGGRIAFAFAIKYPELVRQLIVGGMHPYKVENVYPAIRKRMGIISKGMEAWISYLHENNWKKPEEEERVIRANDPEGLVANDTSILLWEGFGSSLDTIRKYKLPVIIYLGSRDRSYIPLALNYSQENLHVNLVMIDSLNHFTAYTNAKYVLAEVVNLVI